MDSYGVDEVGIAEAVFDNEREWPDELGFRRGERLRVLDTRPAGGLAQGWWLCADSSGQRGIAPANRLHLLTDPPRVITPRRVGDVFSYGDEGRFPNSGARFRFFHDAAHPLRVGGGRETDSGSESSGREPIVRTVPIRLEGGNPAKASPPPPPARRYFHHFPAKGSQPPQPAYDTPAKLLPGGEADSSQSFTPPDGSSLLSDSSNSTTYQDSYDVPSRVLSSEGGGGRGAESGGGRGTSSSVLLNVLGGLYGETGRRRGEGGDSETSTLKRTASPTTPTPTTSNTGVEALPAEMERVSVASDRETEVLIEGARELRLTVQEAMETLFARQQELQSSVALLTSYAANRHWRKRRVLNDSLNDVRKSVSDVCSGLNAFVDFATGCLVNLVSEKAGAEGRGVSRRLTHMLRPLRDSQRLLDARRGELGRGGWSPAALSRDRETASPPDALDQFLAVARGLPDDSRQITAFLQGNASLIFPALLGNAARMTSRAPPAKPKEVPAQSLPLHLPQDGPRVLEEHELDSTTSSDRESLFDDYDFVDGPDQGKTNGKARRDEVSTPTVGSGAGFSAAKTNGFPTSGTNGEEREIVAFYSGQVEQHMGQLTRAIEAFLSSIEENEGPSIYVGKSKLVILSAHKLVYIGDSLGQLLRAEAAVRAKSASDELCTVLKACVAATKSAAASHPSVPAVQAMVDAMVAVSHAAHALRLLLRSFHA